MGSRDDTRLGVATEFNSMGWSRGFARWMECKRSESTRRVNFWAREGVGVVHISVFGGVVDCALVLVRGDG